MPFLPPKSPEMAEFGRPLAAFAAFAWVSGAWLSLALVALSAFAWQYLLFKPHGLIVMLFLASWTVPLWNSVWPQRRFDWVRINSKTPA